MPFNGSNSFTIVNTFVPGTTILSSAVNANFSDIALSGLSDCVTLDAQAPVTGNLLFSSTGYIGLPVGTTGQRPALATQGNLRFNSTLIAPEVFDGSAWDSLSPAVATPQGYLTLTNLASGGPITTSDTTSVSSVYYSPFIGHLCPIYNGTTFINQTFSEQTLSLVSQHTAGTIFDVFACINSGLFTIATGPAWSSSAAGSSSRGTGAGTTQLQRLNGILTNQNSMTARNGSSTFTVAANQGTYLGSIFIDSTPGQCSCFTSFGQNRRWSVWNLYNRQQIFMKIGDSTPNWTYSTNAWRPSNGSTANSLTTFTGYPTERIQLENVQLVRPSGSTTASATYNAAGELGIGFNSTISPSGKTGNVQFERIITFSSGISLDEYFALGDAVAKANVDPGNALGINTVTSLEFAVVSSGSCIVTWFGQETDMVMTASYTG